MADESHGRAIINGMRDIGLLTSLLNTCLLSDLNVPLMVHGIDQIC